MIWAETLFLAVLLVAFPVYSARTFPGELRAIAEGRPGARISFYHSTMRWQWSLLAAGIAVWLLGGRALEEIGFRAPHGWGFWVSLVLALLTAVASTAHRLRVQRSEESRLKMRSQFGGMLAFLPRRTEELRVFNLLSVTAGVCEEVLYRGWLLGFFGPLIGMPAACVVAVISFGLAHSYGKRDVAIKAGAMGAVLTGVYVLSGSLWVPIALHIVMDVNVGMLSTAAFRDEPRREAVT